VLYNVDIIKIKGGVSVQIVYSREKAADENQNYKELYFAAVNKMTDIARAIEKAQKELEELYLSQAEQKGESEI